MHPDLELALELTDLATEIALPRFRARDFTVTIKPDGSPVTEVDQAVERALRERLAQRRPDHAILGEEYGPGGDGEWCWYLDPIDGTTRFVDGDPNWMTFVALAPGGGHRRRRRRRAGARGAVVGGPWGRGVSRRRPTGRLDGGATGRRDRQRRLARHA